MITRITGRSRFACRNSVARRSRLARRNIARRSRLARRNSVARRSGFTCGNRLSVSSSHLI